LRLVPSTLTQNCQHIVILLAIPEFLFLKSRFCPQRVVSVNKPTIWIRWIRIRSLLGWQDPEAGSELFA
jgi:hypothetical protein